MKGLEWVLTRRPLHGTPVAGTDLRVANVMVLKSHDGVEMRPRVFFKVEGLKVTIEILHCDECAG